jgi:hypothetical protein
MTPWTFNVKFRYDTQFTFGPLTFATGEDGNLKLLTPWPAPEHLTSVYGQAPYLPAISSTSDGAFSSLNPSTRPYHRTSKMVQGIPIGASILQSLSGASSSSSSLASLDQDSADDYPEIEGSTCWNSVEEGRLIIMVAPAEAPSHNSSSRYPTVTPHDMKALIIFIRPLIDL